MIKICLTYLKYIQLYILFWHCVWNVSDNLAGVCLCVQGKKCGVLCVSFPVLLSISLFLFFCFFSLWFSLKEVINLLWKRLALTRGKLPSYKIWFARWGKHFSKHFSILRDVFASYLDCWKDIFTVSFCSNFLFMVEKHLLLGCSLGTAEV